MTSHNPLPLPKPANLAGDVLALMIDLLEWQEPIEAAMRRVNNMFSFNDIVASVLRNERQFYKFDGCCIIMQLETYPGYTAYHCFLACGHTQAILNAEPKLAALAKEQGCKYLTLTGRVGWPRRLKHTGWKHTMAVMSKEL